MRSSPNANGLEARGFAHGLSRALAAISLELSLESGPFAPALLDHYAFASTLLEDQRQKYCEICGGISEETRKLLESLVDDFETNVVHPLDCACAQIHQESAQGFTRSIEHAAHELMCRTKQSVLNIKTE